MGRTAIKGTRYLLLRGRENVRPDQLPQLEEALKLNTPLSIAYYLKEELRHLWRECKNVSVNWKSARSLKEPPLG